MGNGGPSKCVRSEMEQYYIHAPSARALLRKDGLLSKEENSTSTANGGRYRCSCTSSRDNAYAKDRSRSTKKECSQRFCLLYVSEKALVKRTMVATTDVRKARRQLLVERRLIRQKEDAFLLTL